VPIDERLADKPDNPRRALKDLDGLPQSIKTRGLMQALVVIRASAFVAARPDVSLPDNVEWVLLAGHRRRAAAQQIGLETLPAVVRDDQAGEKDSIISALVENMHRADLAPMEEARALATLRDLGLSQRESAAEVGIAQGQVSKRLALLDLPVEVQDAVDAGEIEVTAALTMARELPDPVDQLRALDIARGGDRPLTAAVRQLRQQSTVTTASPTAEATPGDRGDDGEGQDRPTLTTQTVPAGANREIETELIPDPVADPTPTASASVGATDAVEQHTAAAQARTDACRAAITSALKATEVTALLLDVTLDPPNARPSRAFATAAQWAGVPVTEDDSTARVDALIRAGGKTAQRLAVAMALARREGDLARGTQARAPWSPAARRHV